MFTQGLPHMRHTETDSVIENVRVYCKANQYDSARKLLTAALASDPDNAQLHFWMGKVWYYSNRFTEALAEFNLARRADPRAAAAAIGLVALYCDLGRYQDGLELHAQLHQNYDPASGLHTLVLHRLAQQHVQCGDLYAALGKRPEAQREYQRALLLDRDNHACRLQLAITCYFAVSYDRVIEETETILAAQPDNFSALLWSGLAFCQKHDHERASEQWEKARRLRPSDPTVAALLQVNG